MAGDDLVTLDEIVEARSRLQGVVRPTPAELSHSLSQRLDCELWLKPEQRQRTGSFKIRGAYNRLSQLPAGAHVVAGSAGNHAQGVALAARLLGHRATIFMPRSASLPKVQATRAYGADVVLEGATVDDAIVAARGFAEGHDATFVPPFDHRQILAGQGTIGLELIEEVPGLRTVLVAIGGGGLAGGIAAAVKRADPGVRMVGVVAAGAASMVLSLAVGEPVAVTPRTVADGIALAAPVPLTVAHAAAFLDEVVEVSDEDISRAVLLLLERAKSVVEPAGAAPLAAVMAEPRLAQGPTALVLGGGNVDSLLLAKQIDYGLELSGRYLSVGVVMPDEPGSLARLTGLMADLGLNVIDVEHHRAGVRLPYGDVELMVTVETRDAGHQDEVVGLLRSSGFSVRPVSEHHPA